MLLGVVPLVIGYDEPVTSQLPPVTVGNGQ